MDVKRPKLEMAEQKGGGCLDPPEIVRELPNFIL